MPIGPRHGNPCSRCPSSRPGQQPHDAVHYGMCSMCWLGATERQRRDARFDAGEGGAVERSRLLHERFEEFYAAREATRANASQGTDEFPAITPDQFGEAA